mmetsp:Transcript_808/g.761  ORF Transcript_808/g.761 Transcript_808/m.761 type:complete len:195 (+) Transcript_808:25-609(+)|eukprot:CAMPEP_0168336756 /NCGR_PEP_ID=MMETSP0213-20121227/11752_1 /TAXON_ID=151035 /ORGANISM="Euplotes harpa, Strain FSP1.4" /LENGTH=194 /DNA_ID=CAMNT_0008342051 /DNA_START=20 /DNA_END=604 /DNA_ORIENTATION=+
MEESEHSEVEEQVGQSEEDKDESSKPHSEYDNSVAELMVLDPPSLYGKGIQLLSIRPMKFYDKLGIFCVADLSVSIAKASYKYDKYDYCYGDPEGIVEIKKSHSFFVGQVKPGTKVPHGIGSMVRDSGHIYEGYWKDGWMHGNGRMTYPDGCTYVGGWKHSKRHGFGQYIDPFYNKTSGKWANDLKQGHFNCKF